MGDIEILVKDSVLIFLGECKVFEVFDGVCWYCNECGYGRFFCVICLLFVILDDKVEVRMMNGVLWIVIFWFEEEKLKKIEIKVV